MKLEFLNSINSSFCYTFMFIFYAIVIMISTPCTSSSKCCFIISILYIFKQYVSLFFPFYNIVDICWKKMVIDMVLYSKGRHKNG